MQMPKELAAHVSHNLRADVGHQADAIAVRHPLDQRRGQEDQRPLPQQLRIAGRDALVDGLADDPRRGHGHQRRDDHEDHGNQRLPLVGQEEGSEPLDQPAVVDLTQHIVVLLIGHQRLDPGLAAQPIIRLAGLRAKGFAQWDSVAVVSV